MERRVGGVRAGSTGFVYAPDVAGKRLSAPDRRASRSNAPGLRFAQHVLAVTEVYVSLAERSNVGLLRLDSFDAEPACWWPDARGGMLKPDAYALVSTSSHADHWWIEVDLATEHLPTLRRKLTSYVDFWIGGQIGPDRTMPRVLVTVPDANRCSGVVRLIRQMPPQTEQLFVVALAKDAADVIVRCLNGPN
jgi:hypothetical protein